jgi:hypothetical protein
LESEPKTACYYEQHDFDSFVEDVADRAVVAVAVGDDYVVVAAVGKL